MNVYTDRQNMRSTDLEYKPHIDGLRAFAILIVVLFHLHPTLFTNGYLGVDVFFVISGFVITQSLYKKYLTDGKIDIVQFYIRRFKRLYPALLAMVGVTTVVYTFLGFLWNTNFYLKSALTSVFAMSNLYFLYSGDNYFHQDLINPLVHTWSLGVEEQFYFIYPLFLISGLWIVRKFRLSLMTFALAILAISVGLYINFSVNSENIFGDFYFPFARFWELGAGCALFFFSLHFPFNFFPRVIATAALGILVGLQFFETGNGNLSVMTLIVVLATSALLYAGLSGGGVVTLLKHTVVTYVGKISYSLYLWHLPVIYFANLYLDTTLFYIAAPFLSVTCAVFSYHIIEKPLRYSEGFGRSLQYAVRIIPYGVVVAMITLIVWQGQIRTAVNHGFNNYGELIKPINYIESNFNLGERIRPNYMIGDLDATLCSYQTEPISLNEYGLRKECLKQVNNKDLYYLTGDSHSLHFVPALDGSSVVENLYFIEFPRQAIVNEYPWKFDQELSREVLEAQRNELERLSATYEHIYYVTSIFLSPWQTQSETIHTNLSKYIETLNRYATLIFIAPTPVFSAGPESCVLLNKHCSVARSSDLERRSIIYNMLKAFEEEYDNVYVFDPYNDICPGEECVIYERETNFVAYIDKDHLSVEQSSLLTVPFDNWLQEQFTRGEKRSPEK